MAPWPVPNFCNKNENACQVQVHEREEGGEARCRHDSASSRADPCREPRGRHLLQRPKAPRQRRVPPSERRRERGARRGWPRRRACAHGRWPHRARHRQPPARPGNRGRDY